MVMGIMECKNEQIYINDLIDKLNVSDNMKDEFKAFNLAYYNNYENGKIKPSFLWMPSSEYLAVEKLNRKNMQLTFSLLGFFLGPIGYLIKGMFVKGFILIAPALVLLYFLPKGNMSEIILHGIWYFYAVFCSLMLRRDYFQHKCLNNKVIKEYLKSKQLCFIPHGGMSPEELLNNPLIKKKDDKIWFQVMMVSLTIIAFGVLLALTIPLNF